jgi:polyhydroxyalkanoate synthase subunit PhaC
MSWHPGQPESAQPGARGARTPRPLAAMAAAVLAASHKPMAEEALKSIAASLHTVPGGIDWPAFQAGVARYQSHPYRYTRPSYPVLALAGRVSLCDAGGSGPPILIVSSMVNKGYVLDLYPDHSLVEALREAGHRVLIIDWGDPAQTDAPLTLDALIVARLLPLLHEAAKVAGPMAVFGYCMGGLLGLAGAVLTGPQVVNKLAVAAMPWDFSVTPSSGHMQLARPVLEPYLTGTQVVPPEAMQSYFWQLDPWSPVQRLVALGRETDAARLQFLLTLEDWLHDGLALDGPIAAEILLDWYADNRTLKGTWQIDNRTITPAALSVPLWVCITQNDVLVPTACSLPAVGQSKGATVHLAATGHVGLVCGRKAKTQLYNPLTTWLKGTNHA